jgi:hypothetical protein
MEVSGSGSRGDRPIDRSPDLDDRPPSTTARSRRPPDLDRPRVESSRVDDGLDRGRAVRDGRTDGRTDGPTDGTDRTDRPTDRTDRTLSRARSFARFFDRGARAREREI